MEETRQRDKSQSHPARSEICTDPISQPSTLPEYRDVLIGLRKRLLERTRELSRLLSITPDAGLRTKEYFKLDHSLFSQIHPRLVSHDYDEIIKSYRSMKSVWGKTETPFLAQLDEGFEEPKTINRQPSGHSPIVVSTHDFIPNWRQQRDAHVGKFIKALDQGSQHQKHIRIQIEANEEEANDPSAKLYKFSRATLTKLNQHIHDYFIFDPPSALSEDDNTKRRRTRLITHQHDTPAEDTDSQALDQVKDTDLKQEQMQDESNNDDIYVANDNEQSVESSVNDYEFKDMRRKRKRKSMLSNLKSGEVSPISNGQMFVSPLHLKDNVVISTGFGELTKNGVAFTSSKDLKSDTLTSIFKFHSEALKKIAKVERTINQNDSKIEDIDSRAINIVGSTIKRAENKLSVLEKIFFNIKDSQTAERIRNKLLDIGFTNARAPLKVLEQYDDYIDPGFLTLTESNKESMKKMQKHFINKKMDPTKAEGSFSNEQLHWDFNMIDASQKQRELAKDDMDYFMELSKFKQLFHELSIHMTAIESCTLNLVLFGTQTRNNKIQSIIQAYVGWCCQNHTCGPCDAHNEKNQGNGSNILGKLMTMGTQANVYSNRYGFSITTKEEQPFSSISADSVMFGNDVDVKQLLDTYIIDIKDIMQSTTEEKGGRGAVTLSLLLFIILIMNPLKNVINFNILLHYLTSSGVYYVVCNKNQINFKLDVSSVERSSVVLLSCYEALQYVLNYLSSPPKGLITGEYNVFKSVLFPLTREPGNLSHVDMNVHYTPHISSNQITQGILHSPDSEKLFGGTIAINAPFRLDSCNDSFNINRYNKNDYESAGISVQKGMNGNVFYCHKTGLTYNVLSCCSGNSLNTSTSVTVFVESVIDLKDFNSLSLEETVDKAQPQANNQRRHMKAVERKVEKVISLEPKQIIIHVFETEIDTRQVSSTNEDEETNSRVRKLETNEIRSVKSLKHMGDTKPEHLADDMAFYLKILDEYAEEYNNEVIACKQLRSYGTTMTPPFEIITGHIVESAYKTETDIMRQRDTSENLINMMTDCLPIYYRRLKFTNALEFVLLSALMLEEVMKKRQTTSPAWQAEVFMSSDNEKKQYQHQQICRFLTKMKYRPYTYVIGGTRVIVPQYNIEKTLKQSLGVYPAFVQMLADRRITVAPNATELLIETLWVLYSAQTTQMFDADPVEALYSLRIPDIVNVFMASPFIHNIYFHNYARFVEEAGLNWFPSQEEYKKLVCRDQYNKPIIEMAIRENIGEAMKIVNNQVEVLLHTKPEHMETTTCSMFYDNNLIFPEILIERNFGSFAISCIYEKRKRVTKKKRASLEGVHSQPNLLASTPHDDGLMHSHEDYVSSI